MKMCDLSNEKLFAIVKHSKSKETVVIASNFLLARENVSEEIMKHLITNGANSVIQNVAQEILADDINTSEDMLNYLAMYGGIPTIALKAQRKLLQKIDVKQSTVVNIMKQAIGNGVAVDAAILLAKREDTSLASTKIALNQNRDYRCWIEVQKAFLSRAIKTSDDISMEILKYVAMYGYEDNVAREAIQVLLVRVLPDDDCLFEIIRSARYEFVVKEIAIYLINHNNSANILELLVSISKRKGNEKILQDVLKLILVKVPVSEKLIRFISSLEGCEKVSLKLQNRILKDEVLSDSRSLSDDLLAFLSTSGRSLKIKTTAFNILEKSSAMIELEIFRDIARNSELEKIGIKATNLVAEKEDGYYYLKEIACYAKLENVACRALQRLSMFPSDNSEIFMKIVNIGNVPLARKLALEEIIKSEKTSLDALKILAMSSSPHLDDRSFLATKAIIERKVLSCNDLIIISLRCSIKAKQLIYEALVKMEDVGVDTLLQIIPDIESDTFYEEALNKLLSLPNLNEHSLYEFAMKHKGTAIERRIKERLNSTEWELVHSLVS